MKRFLTLALIVVVVVAVGSAAYLRFASQPSTAASASNLPTAAVQRGTLAATVNAAGNITAAQDVTLGFQQSGIVQKVNVHVGDQVRAGQVLAQLDSSDLSLQVQNAQTNLNVAQDKLAQAKNPNAAQDIASARAQLDAAQANYNKLVAGPAAADVSSAQSAIASAQAAYSAAVKSAGTSDNSLTAAAAALEKAQATVQQAQAAYDRVAGDPNVGASQQALALQQATTDFQQAKANYTALQATSQTDANSKVQAAAASLQQARDNLAKLQGQVTQNDIIASQAQVTQAKSNLEKLLAGSDANTLDIAQNGVSQAEIALKQAQLKLQQAQIVAPFDGVVTAVGITPGQSASTGSGTQTTPAIEVADLGHLQVIVNMAEVDVSRIKVGQDAQITLDALPDANLAGKVTEISPAGVQSQGVVNYPVTVALVDTGTGVKTGMTANLNIVTDEHDDVLMVPNRAVRTVGRQKTVTVLFEGQQIQVPVQTGLSNDTNTEISSGVKEGDTVVLSTTTTSQGQFRGGPGGFAGPGAFGR